MVGPDPPAPSSVRRKTLVATTSPPTSGPVEPSSSEGPPLRMFSVQLTSAVSPDTETSTSVRKNWMYSVLAMISA